MDYFMMKKKLKDFGFYTRDRDDPLSLLKVMHVPKKRCILCGRYQRL